ncbi:TIGR04076 family protein [Dethiosulfatarculus sandiegensis]|uniref:TIGR04076 family protein n=1 Tax=Dethiosulfatarculus sandiegensis TaxID=1429043 RepID=A0A0D2JPK3_9BACT|nr:TIGR04076 family protein [Dethiosulfatarculus sandiegensis]KIX11410.1 hypothetical protein X474_24395 [Dethiosulfatarculus sandiegensis]
MSDYRKVKIKVKSVEGTCHAGHKPGDEWVVEAHTPEGLCVHAYSALDPMIRAFMFDASIPWLDEEGRLELVCPDPDNPVVFTLEKMD